MALLALLRRAEAALRGFAAIGRRTRGCRRADKAGAALREVGAGQARVVILPLHPRG